MSYKYALIENDVVTQINMSPIILNFEPNSQWMEVSIRNPSPDIGWIYQLSTDTFTKPKDVGATPIEDVQLEARKAIECAATKARKAHMPDEYGQVELYREKYEQAVDFLSSQDVVHYPDYPLLHIESRILNIPMKDIAENIIKRRSEWISKMIEIEELRLYGKVNIAFCTTENEVQILVTHLVRKLQELELASQ